jgi:TRIAD3 protein (E3 ubiquitin-protein ligase RNF216)
MTCTRNGCNNIQCYVCSKSCGYDHFNDRTRGGREGNCPLFENAEERHEREVKEAERIALAKIRAEHPEYTDDDLRVKVSQDVQDDEDRRRQRHPRNPVAANAYIRFENRQPQIG